MSLAGSASQSITAAEGGTVALTGNAVSVAVPANAVSETTTLSIVPQSTFAQPSAGYGAVGSQSYNLTAQTGAGASFSQFNDSLTLTFAYTDSQIAGFDEATLRVSYWSETTGEWLNLPTTVNAAANSVTAPVNHFTKFILQAKSKTVPAGSLIKTADSTAVYYLGHDSKRYVFPDDKVYKSWYADFSDVLTISRDKMLVYSLGGNVTVRQGTNLVQFVSYDNAGKMMVDDPKVYTLEPNGALRWIKTAAIASALYGTAWESKIVPVSNYLFGNYTIGAALETASFPTGSVVMESSSGALYYINGTQKRLVTAGGKSANSFQAKHNLSAANLNSYASGANLDDYQNSISWTGSK